MPDKHSILIVDDEPHSQDVLAGFLAREGYTLAFAANGQETLDYVYQHPTDAILLDLMMPDISGLEVCRRLKASEEYKHIPIIIVTALGSKKDLIQGFEAGADDFLTKPVNRVELIARIRSMLRIKSQYDDLKALSDLREELAHSIMHDMRTPLNVILGYTELYQEIEIGETEKLEYIKDIEAQVHRLNSFLTDMLMMTKMESGQIALRYTSVELRSLLQRSVKDHSIIAQSRGVQLVQDLPTHMPEIMVDKNLFQRVLDNLMSNAIKFSPSNSRITIQVRYQENNDNPTQDSPVKVSISVLDEGPGIPEEYRESIFEKFAVSKLQQENIKHIGAYI